MQIADCSINRGAERLSERGERDGKKAETFPGGETERRSSAPAAAGAAPPQTPGGRTSAQRGAAQPRPEAPPGERERTNPPKGGGARGDRRPRPKRARAQGRGARGRPAAPRSPARAREGARRRGEPQSERKGGHSPQQEPLRADGAATTRSRGASAGGTPWGAKRARPPTRAAARGGHGEPEKGRRRNEPHPGESAYIFCSELARNDRPRAGAHPRSGLPGADLEPHEPPRERGEDGGHAHKTTHRTSAALRRSEPTRQRRRGRRKWRR